MSKDKLKLDYCGCCEGTRKLTPVKIENPPGLSALKYRVGTHSKFKASMIAKVSQHAALQNLRTRENDDLAIAILDSWATVADVLTFYQERIANEGYLRTATERRSVLELARAIGYELNPGVAASAYLAFTVEDAPGAPGHATIGEGVKVMSVPGQDEKPQIFETIEKIEARAELNDLKPQQTVSQEIKWGSKDLYLNGLSTHLTPGDAILIIGDERERDSGSEHWDFRILQTVTPYPERNYTHVTWKVGLGHEKPIVEPAENPRVFAFRQRAAFFGYNAPDWRTMPDKIKEAAIAHAHYGTFSDPEWPGFDIFAKGKKPTIYLDAAYPKILVDSWVALMKPGYKELYKVVRVETDSCTNFTLSSKTTRLEFDTSEHLNFFNRRDTVIFAQSEQLELAKKPLTYPVYGNKIVLDRPVEGLDFGRKIIVSGKRMRVKITDATSSLKLISQDALESVDLKQNELLLVQEPPSLDNDGKVKWHLVDRNGFDGFVTIAPDKIVCEDNVARVNADGLFLISEDGLEGTILKKGDELKVLEVPPFVDSDWCLVWHLKDRNGFEGFVTIESDKIVPTPADKDDETINEVAFIKSVPDPAAAILESSLLNVYDCATVHIYANVVLATHGETTREVLGSGDGSQVNQRFVLKKPPLTFVSASTASGAESTIELYVNDVMWEEEQSLYGLDPSSQSYILRIDDDGTTAVIFGDGKKGARLPSGRENIVATYRSGIGLEGEVGANKLTLLQKRPLGIREVTNPLPASGAASPEKLEDARINAPFTVLALERIVSLKDFEDFARSFSGIGKAQAVAIWKGENRIVHITVASANGKQIDPKSDLYSHLTNAINAVNPSGKQVCVESFKPLYFNVKAKVQVDPHYIAVDVLTNAKTALQTAFAFNKRAFGQAVTSSEIMTVIQNVSGVIFTDLEQLYLTTDSESKPVPAVLPAAPAHMEGNLIKPAELLLINQAGIIMTEI